MGILFRYSNNSKYLIEILISLKGEMTLGKITVKDASKEMEISEQFLRILIREGKFPWATATQIGGPESRWTYFINAEAFKRYMKGES